MPARSNMDLCVARAWTAAVGGPVERHVRPRVLSEVHQLPCLTSALGVLG